MSGYSAVLLVPFTVTLLLLLLFTYVIGQKRRSRVKTAFLIFTAVMIACTTCELVLRMNLSASLNRLVVQVGLVFMMFSGFVYMSFIYAVIQRPADLPYKIILTAVFVGALLTFLPETFVIGVSEQYGVATAHTAPLLAGVMVVVLLTPATFAFALCVRHHRLSRNDRRRRILRLLIAGSLMSLLLSTAVLAVIPFIFAKQNEPQLFFSVTVLVHFGYMYVAVSKYHFLTVNIDEIEQVSNTLFAKMMDAVVVFGTSGEVVQANDEAHALFGEHVNLAQIQSLLPDYQLSENYDRWRTKLQSEAEPVHVLVSQTDFGADGFPLGKLLLVRNISDDVAREDERADMQQRIQQSEKLELVGQLAGGVAHDFNNQLTGIMGFAELLRAELDGDDELLSCVDEITTACEHSAALVRHLLAYSRKGPYVRELVDVRVLVEDVVSLLKHSIDKSIQISVQLEAEQHEIRGDPSQLQSALLNLAVNARDAMAAGGTLTFRTRVVDAPTADTRAALDGDQHGRLLSLTVSDTGTGIAPEVRPKIFDPFFTTKAPGRGTGMGLAAVYGTVKNHQGVIELETASDRGSTFRLLLPLNPG